MITAHTLGNWISKDGQIYAEETGKTLAVIPYFDKENKEEKANATLMETSPEMLEVLRDIYASNIHLENSDQEPAWFQNCCEAITNATS